MSSHENMNLEFQRRLDRLRGPSPRKYERVRHKRRRNDHLGESSKQTQKDNDHQALIIDNGAYSIKIGLSNDSEPNIIPNCIMKAKSERKRLFIGNQINECRDLSGLYYLLPCERGYITKWDVQKPVWDYVFNKNFCPINDNPVLMTQPLFNFKSVQDCIDEIFYEEYEVKAMFRVNPTDLAKIKYISDNKLPPDTPCVIVDSGFSFTHIIPYIKGNKYLKAIKRLNVGGKLLTNNLKDIISYRQYNVMEETYVINQVKEDTCYVCEDMKKELKIAEKHGAENHIVKNYVLPDFNNIRRGYIQDPNAVDERAENCQILRLNNERFVVPEILFHPSDIGMKSMGVAQAIVKSIKLCPKDQQEALTRNIVLIGGNCKFPGFQKRMYAELRSLLPDNWTLKVFQPEDPITYVWQGGKPLAKNPNFEAYVVTKSEYEELGSTIIQQRFNNWMVAKEEPEPPARIKSSAPPVSLLERFRNKSIFGKFDPNEPVTEEPTAATTSQGAVVEISSTSNTSDEPDSTGSEELPGEGFPHVTAESELSPKKLKTSKSNDSAKKMIPVNPADYQEEDVMHMFPFDTNSYL